MLKTGRIVVLVAVGAGLWQTGSGAWIHAKARLAQWLLVQAWERTLAGETAVRPWPWADTWPVGRLRIPAHSLDVIVLQGDSGRSLAFGPGLAAGSARPGRPGTTLISAHRDTHFRALADIRSGDAIDFETADGLSTYRVTGAAVINSEHTEIANNPLQNELILSTCYPFDAPIPGGPLRYMVYAEHTLQKPADRNVK